MRAILGLLCLLTFTCTATAEADPSATRSEKLAAAEALVIEIASRRSDGEPEDLPDGVARAVGAWTEQSVEHS